jgi:hypothetical protein
MSTLGRTLGTIALMLAALAGLLMSLCGGVFTISGFGVREMAGVLVISIPSLLLGLAVLWLAGRRLRARRGRRPGSEGPVRPPAR